MDSNITFRIDADVKEQMAEICKQLGMSTSTAFNLFANAFVREKGMPFPVSLSKKERYLETDRILDDASQILDDFRADYKRMAE